MKAIIVIPTLNEEKSIPVLIDKLSIFLKTFTVLFVDDNSSDETQSRIKKSKKKYKNINYIFKTNNFGIGNAIKDGIEFAYKHGYDMCITMDADGTHNPNKIYSMLKIMKSRKYDIISTNRFAIKNSIDNFRKDVLDSLKSFNPQKNNFYYFHLHAPHDPFTYFDEYPKEGSVSLSKTEEYIKFKKFFLNKLLHILKDEKFNNSRIIITGDHGWRQDNRINKYQTSLYLKNYPNFELEDNFFVQDLGFLINNSFK